MTNETQFLTPLLKRGKTGGGPSKMLIDRIRATEVLDAAIKAFTAPVVEGFDERLSPQLLDGETLPDHAFTLELFRRSVTSARDELVAADDRYVSMETRKSLLSMQCDRVARYEVYPNAQRIRHRIEALVGKDAAYPFHGIRGRMRRKPCRLLDQLGLMVHFLSRPMDELLEVKAPGFSAERDRWLRDLGPGYDKLTRMHKQLVLDRRRVEGFFLKRQEAMKRFDWVYGESVRFAEIVFRIAGFEKAVKSLRNRSQVRRMVRWAHDKRQARKTTATVSTSPTPKRKTSATPSATGKVLQFVSGWLRKAV